MNDHCLMHHGVKGQRWGVRRYQNEDGSLTSAGKKQQAKKEAEAKKALVEAKEKYKAVTADKKKAVAKKIGTASGVILGTASLTAAVAVGKKYIERALGKAILNLAWE